MLLWRVGAELLKESEPSPAQLWAEVSASCAAPLEIQSLVPPLTLTLRLLLSLHLSQRPVHRSV